MKISKDLTDQAILAETGARLAHRRLELQLTQAELAGQAGVAKRTLERIEAGASVQTASLIRILRALDLLEDLDRAIAEAKPTPMQLLEHHGKPRKRASKRRRRQAAAGEPWTWRE
jgi:transcriptional regulator with XRE-family HTH domain